MTKTLYTQHWQTARDAAEQAGHQIIEHGWEQHVIIDHQKKLVYRYPRHEAAAAKLADEVAVLYHIHEQTWPTLLPVMREHNELFTVYDYIPGEVLDGDELAHLDEGDYNRIGSAIGVFLAQFHKLDHAVVDAKKTSHNTSLLDYYQDRILSAPASPFYTSAHLALEYVTSNCSHATNAVVHGDLHGLNIVIDTQAKRLSGVIDLSEMEVGDPHQDFRKLFMTDARLLDPAIAAYHEACGLSINADQARAWAYVNEWANLCHFGDQPENATYQRALRHLTLWGQI